MNQRTEKYKIKIKKSLYNLINNLDYNEINITKLCKEAQISRQGFYLYYKTIDDIILEQVDELWKDVNDKIQNLGTCEFFIDYIYDYYLNLHLNTPKLFSKNIRTVAKPRHKKNMKKFIGKYIKDKDDFTLIEQYQIEIETSIIISVFEQWFDNDFDLSKQDFLIVLKKYITWEKLWK